MRIFYLRDQNAIEEKAKTMLEKTPSFAKDGTIIQRSIVVGFDCERPYDPVTRHQGKIAAIQVAYDDTIRDYCVSPLNQLPPSLRILMECPSIIKIGLRVSGD